MKRLALLFVCFSFALNGLPAQKNLKDSTEKAIGRTRSEAAQNQEMPSREKALHQWDHDSLLLAKRLQTLEEERGRADKIFDKFFDSIEGIISPYSLIFTVISIVFTLISIALLVLQVLVTRRDNRIMDELRKNYEDSIRKQDENNSKLLNAVVGNINQTTTFIGSYDSLLKLQEDAKKIQDRLNDFEQREKDHKKAFEEIQKDKNGKAMRLIEGALKANFGSTYFSNYDLPKFNSFVIEVTPYLATMGEGDQASDWNGDVFFVLGLNQFLSGQARDAEKYFATAIKKIEGFLKETPSDLAVLFPEKDRYAEYGGIEGWNRILLGKCLFYMGLNHYRLGKFALAAEEFGKGLQHSPNDFDINFLIFQSKYWGRLFGRLPDALEQMERLEKDIQNLSAKDEKSKRMILARLYKKIGDFYLPSALDDRYKQDKSPEKALFYYEKAYGVVQDLNGELKNVPREYSHIVPMVYFSLGKALMEAGMTTPQNPMHLFGETERICEQVIVNIKNPETRYILYYTMSYCCHLQGQNREAGYNIALALTEMDNFCANPDFYGYSPINNIMLPSPELRDELNAFKLKLFQRSAS